MTDDMALRLLTAPYTEWLTTLSRQSMTDLLELSRCQPTADDLLLPFLAALFKSLEGGSVCMHRSEQTLLRRLPEWQHSRVHDLVKHWQEFAQRYPELITTSVDEMKPIVINDLLAGFQGIVKSAETVVEHLHTLSTADEAAVPSDISTQICDDTDYQLSDDQLSALQMALSRRLCIISGGPGTGKTSIVVNILRCLYRTHRAGSVLLCAPTGRAAQRMTESIHAQASRMSDEDEVAWLQSLQAKTIHRVLEVDHYGRFRYHHEHMLEADTMILDELSMVDIRLMSSLLQALPMSCRVVMLGDRDQLPSVEAGVPLTTLLQGDEWPIASLHTSFRSVNSILTLARAVNEGREISDELLPSKSLSDIGSPGCMLYDTDINHRDRYLALIAAWFQLVYTPAFLELLKQLVDFADLGEYRQQLDQVFEAINSGRVLCLTRSGNSGVVTVNQILTTYLRKHTSTHSSRSPIGLPVMVTQHDALRDLSNGEVGVLLKGVNGDQQVVFRKSDRDICYPLESLAHWEPAFAHTVHKSQGSEYGCVMIMADVPPEHALLTREVLYTGITRARQSVVVVGHRAVMQAGAQRSIDRESL